MQKSVPPFLLPIRTLTHCSFFGHHTNSGRGRMGETMANSHLTLVALVTEKRTVTPRRRPNAAVRTREYLTEAEVERLMEAAKGNRWGHRDATMVLVAYRHGLRAAELVDLRWDQ